MRKIILVLLSIIICFELSAQSDYYWYKGEKIPLTKSTKKKFVVLESFEDTIKLKKNNKSKTKTTNILDKKEVNHMAGLKPYKAKPIKQKKYVIVEDEDNLLELSQQDNNLFVTPYYIADGKEIGVSYLFYVMLKKENDISLLEIMAKENGVEILGNNEFMPLWYTLSCSKESKGNAVEMANKFYESGLFEATDIDFMIKLETLSYSNCRTNDNLYASQWNLRDPYGINYCEAYNYKVKNNNVIVAVIDKGIKYGHEDLPNVLDICYDAATGGPCNKNVYSRHGTNVAGVIGAKTDNGKGIVGIAPNCSIMNIRLDVNVNEVDIMTATLNSINFAKENGASVINMSMGWSGNVYDNRLYQSIDGALRYGRNGLGCILIFAAGNNNQNDIVLPAKLHNGNIVVGAINQEGKRWEENSMEGSSYGVKLDIVAPGIGIRTTDTVMNHYNQNFFATSAAAPHVAGAAALILSIKPNLTQLQVSQLIENNATKIREDLYNYFIDLNKSQTNLWNPYVGYGLLNVGASLQGMCDNVNYTNPNLNTYYKINACITTISNTKVLSGAKLEVDIIKSTTINSLEVPLGSELEIY